MIERFVRAQEWIPQSITCLKHYSPVVTKTEAPGLNTWVEWRLYKYMFCSEALCFYSWRGTFFWNLLAFGKHHIKTYILLYLHSLSVCIHIWHGFNPITRWGTYSWYWCCYTVWYHSILNTLIITNTLKHSYTYIHSYVLWDRCDVWCFALPHHLWQKKAQRQYIDTLTVSMPRPWSI